MAEETILQHWILTKFVFPFLLIFFIVFAVLEKTKVLGDDKKQLNAMISFVIGLIFVGSVFPKEVVGNLILFLTVSLIVVFVILLLWGFVSVDKQTEFSVGSGMKKFGAAVIIIATIIAVIWATGSGDFIIRILFKQSWSKSFWTNFLFIIAIAGAIATVLKKSGS